MEAYSERETSAKARQSVKAAIVAVLMGSAVVERPAASVASDALADTVKTLQIPEAKAEVNAVEEAEEKPKHQFNIVYTGESTPPPPSPHPNIKKYSLPAALTESVGAFLTEHPLQDLSSEAKVSLVLALEKCSNLSGLPDTLRYMGLEEVTFQPSERLRRTCEGYARESIPLVIRAIFDDARGGDIPAMLALIYLLDPGGPGIRVQIENQEHESGISAYEIYPEVHRLAYRSISSGNLYYAKDVSSQLLIHGTHGIPGLQADGSYISEPHRPSFVRAVAYLEARWAIGADPSRQARGMGLLRQLSDEEQIEMQRQADVLVAGWLSLPVLYDSDLKAQGYWEPGLY